MKKGFTLLELLIVITILAVLAGAMIPLFKSSKSDAQDAKAKADLDAIKSAAVMYKYDTTKWPQVGSAGNTTCLVNNNGTNCPDNVTGGWKGPYLTNWGNDPWSNPYQIYATAGNMLYAQSFGPDGNSTSCGAQCNTTLRNPCDICVVITANNST